MLLHVMDMRSKIPTVLGFGRLAVGGPDHEDGAHHRGPGPTEQHTDLLFAVDSSRLGYRVLEATTGKEAIEAANPQIGPIDLILCDLTLLIPLVQSSLGSLSSRSKCGGPHRLRNTTNRLEREREEGF